MNVKSSLVLICRIFVSLPGFGYSLFENNFKSSTPNSWRKHLGGEERWKPQGNALPSKPQSDPPGRQAGRQALWSPPAADLVGDNAAPGERLPEGLKAHDGGLCLKARTPIYCILLPFNAKRRTVKPEV